MQQILILGGGAAGLAAALAAAQTAEGRAHITVLDKNAKVGKKLLATGNGRCNLDIRESHTHCFAWMKPGVYS